jgi:hypothetical protein
MTCGTHDEYFILIFGNYGTFSSLESSIVASSLQSLKIHESRMYMLFGTCWKYGDNSRDDADDQGCH